VKAAPLISALSGLALFALAGGAAAQDLVLALSWQNAFCEGRPDRPECEDMRSRDAAASQFSLHGLWPQPRDNVYCAVSARDQRHDEDGRWGRLPEPELSRATRDRLADAMPGVASRLHRHQWIKHGGCYARDAETYFEDALKWIDAVNASPLRALFSRSVGETVSRRAAEQALGRAGAFRIRFVCATDRDSGRRLVRDIRISLGPGRTLDEALRAGRRTTGGCRSGIVDPFGDQ